MGKDRDRSIADFYKKVQEETIDMPLLMTMTNNLNVYSPEDMEHLAKIFLDILTAPQVSKAPHSLSPADLGSTALYVGYRESSYFIKLVKEKYGKSPLEMRASFK